MLNTKFSALYALNAALYGAVIIYLAITFVYILFKYSNKTQENVKQHLWCLVGVSVTILNRN